MSAEATTPVHVVSEFDLTTTPYEDHTHGSTTIHRELTSRLSGASYVTVLLTHADVLIGTTAFNQTQPRVPVTVDMNHRQLAKLTPGTRLEMDARILRIGNAAIVGEVTFSDYEKIVATTHVTFSISPRPQDSGTIDFPIGVTRPGGKPTMPLVDRVGLRVLDTGITEVDLTSDNINASKGLQGGITAFAGEYAAESLLAPGESIIDCDVRYLSGIRTGPGRAHAKRVAPNLIRAEILDHGKDDRLCVVATFRTGTW